MKKKSAWIGLLVILVSVVSYIIVDIQYKPDLSVINTKGETCYIDGTLKDIVPHEGILAKNPFGESKRLEFLNEKGEVIDLDTPVVNYVTSEQVQQFMTRLETNLDSKPLPIKFYIRPILKLEPIEVTVVVKSEGVVVEPQILNFKTDRIPTHYALSYKGKVIDGPYNPWADTDAFNNFKIVGQPFIRKDLNNVYYIDIQDKKVFEPSSIEKVVLKSDGDKPDEFCGEFLDDAFNNLPLRFRFFALQDGLTLRWKDMLELTDDDIKLYNESYKDDKVKSAKEFSDTRVAYFDSSVNAIEVNSNQGYKNSFANLFNRNDYYYTVAGNNWSKKVDIYTISELKKFALKDMKSTLSHEFGHFIDDNLSSYYVSTQELETMKNELPYGYNAMYREEVIATAFQVYFTEKERMKKDAPTSYRICEELLTCLDMSLADRLTELSKSL